MSERARFALILLTAAALRLLWLSRLPAPAGDEGNWADYAWHIAHARYYVPVASSTYASSLYAWILAPLVTLFGVDFAALRMVNALSGIAAVALVYAVVRRPNGAACAAAAALLLAVHPAHVAWSRTASVPYVLQSTLGLLGVWLLALSSPTQRMSHALGILVLAVGFHFGPIQVVVGLACLLWLARDGRWRRLLTTTSLVALAIGIAIVTPMVATSMGLMDSAARPVHLASPSVWLGILRMLRGELFSISGGLTIRHFTAFDAPAFLVYATVIGWFCVVAVAIGGQRSSPPGRFATLTLLVWVVLLPALLAARGLDWTLSNIDSDRYVVHALPFMAIAIGTAWQSSPTSESAHAPARSLVVALVTIFATSTAAFFFGHNLLAGGRDRGYPILSGGGYRGWRVADGEPVIVRAAQRARARASNRSADFIVGDYSFEAPARFLLRGTQFRVLPARAWDGVVRRPTCLLSYDVRVYADELVRFRPPAVESVYRDAAGNPLAWFHCWERPRTQIFPRSLSR